MSMHPIFVSGKGELNGLRSPGAKVLEYGDAVSTAVGYWGSLVCRPGCCWRAGLELLRQRCRALLPRPGDLVHHAAHRVSGDEIFQR